jgi:hypothetical protein
MAQYSVTLNAAQEDMLTFVLADINRERALEVPPLAALTKAQAVQGAVVRRLTDEYSQRTAAKQERLREKYVQATPEQQAEVDQVLGL